MDKHNHVFISVCLTGAGTKKDQAPTVPYTPEEISDQIIECAKAGASIAHIHVREDKMVNGKMEIGYKSMSLDKFSETVMLTRKKCADTGTDIIINLTTSGGEYEDEKRLQHLGALKPELCSFDPGTLNWSNSFIFENSPRFLNKLSEEVVKHNIKPEFEIFDTGFIDSANYYIQKHNIPGRPYYQFIMGVGGAMPGTTENLAFLVNKLPDNALWSVSGIGKTHMPMMLAGLSLGCNGLRVGLEDNIIFGKDSEKNKIIATNPMLVKRAAELIRLSGKEVATASITREILGLQKQSN